MDEHWKTFFQALGSGSVCIAGIIGGNIDKIELVLRWTSLSVGIVAGCITIALGIRAWRKK